MELFLTLGLSKCDLIFLKGGTVSVRSLGNLICVSILVWGVEVVLEGGTHIVRLIPAHEGGHS